MTVSTITSLVSGLNRSLGNQDSKVADAVRTVVSAGQQPYTLPPNIPQDTTSFPTAAVLQNQVASLRIASQNIAQAGSTLDVAGGAGGEISRVLGQLRSLAARANSQDLSVAERIQISGQVQALRQAINRIAATASGAEKPAEGSATLATTPFALGKLSDEELFGTDTLDVSTQAAAAKTLGVVDTAQRVVDAQLTSIANYRAGIYIAAGTIESAIQNIDAARGTFSADDFADSTLTNTSETALADQVNASVTAQTNRLPASILQLLSE